MKEFIQNYLKKYNKSFSEKNFEEIKNFCEILKEAISKKKNIFICGNGGSAANAIHMANDINFFLIKKNYQANIESLSSNQAIITCIANDFGYEKIFSEQIKIKGNKNDLLICLSGSGNSLNIVNAIEIANKKELITFSIVGFDGGAAKKKSKYAFHLEVNDMQLSEDSQHFINHVCSKWLIENI